MLLFSAPQIKTDRKLSLSPTFQSSKTWCSPRLGVYYWFVLGLGLGLGFSSATLISERWKQRMSTEGRGAWHWWPLWCLLPWPCLHYSSPSATTATFATRSPSTSRTTAKVSRVAFGSWENAINISLMLFFMGRTAGVILLCSKM